MNQFEKNCYNEIVKKIGEENNYVGFDMSKTHDQDNSKIDNHNLKILEKCFSNSNAKEIHSMLDCWKGTMFFSESRNFNDAIQEFGGWTTHEILLWLYTKGQEFILNKELEEIMSKIEVDESTELEENNDNLENSRVIPRTLRYKILHRQKWRCNFCNCILKFNKDSKWEGEIAHIDHIHPYSKRKSYESGSENINELSNLQALCPKCNLSKSNKEIN